MNHEDERGEIRDILTGIETDAVTYITTKAGAIRGNHYHVHTEQWEYVVSGSFEYASRMGPEAKIERGVLKAGDLAYHPVGEQHAFRALEDSVLISLTKGPRQGENYEQDVIRLKEPILG